jgi:Fasciclin domain
VQHVRERGLRRVAHPVAEAARDARPMDRIDAREMRQRSRPQAVLLVPTGPQQADGQQGTGRTPIAEESDMPMTEHQQQALESQPAQGQRQTAAAGASDMPATEHQQQVLQDQPSQGQGQQQMQVEGQPDLPREATAVGADIQADNGVIHVIDAVLLPQDVLKMLEEVNESQN